MISSPPKKTAWFYLINASWLPKFGLANAALFYFLFHSFRNDQTFLIPENLKYSIMGAFYVTAPILSLILVVTAIGNLLYKQWKKGLIRLGAGLILLVVSSMVYIGQTSGARLRSDTVTENKRIMAVTSRVLSKYFKVNGHYPATLKEVDYYKYRLYPGDSIRILDTYGRPFDYRSSVDKQSYELRSLGPDQVYGTSDDLVAK